jgi:site-specific DNA-methyltransferase (adenine-specific)
MKEENGMTATPVEPIVMRSSRVTVTLYCGDCHDLLPIEADAVVSDPPYGMISKPIGCWEHDKPKDWDVTVPAAVWMRSRVAVVTASEPYATQLITESPLPFRFDLVWVKNCVTNAVNANKMPMRRHERVLVFGDYVWHPIERHRTSDEMKRLNKQQRQTMAMASPDSVLEIDAVNNRSGDRTEHPSQKPVRLMETLITQFTDGTILDPFMGSGTTGVACIRTGRNFIGVEKDERYFEIAVERIRRELAQERLF